MSFFDDKQEILKIELTTYGRFLISRGKFKPVYYAFFDDDILYDAKYANVTESQNNIQDRILDETLSLKPQTTFTSLENNINTNALVFDEIKQLKMEEGQISADKNYALSLPLANSSLGLEYAPSWTVNAINGSVNNIENYIDNSSSGYATLQPFLKIPQINLNESVFDIKKTINYLNVPEGYEQIHTVVENNDEFVYFMSEDKILLDVLESNVDSLKESFDIEIFLEEEETIPGTQEKKKVLKSLSFLKKNITILNDILLDEPITFSQEINEDYAEYYFEIAVDDEINLPPTQRTTYAGHGRPGAAPPYGANC